jgi:hypothetical protein
MWVKGVSAPRVAANPGMENNGNCERVVSIAGLAGDRGPDVLERWLTA